MKINGGIKKMNIERKTKEYYVYNGKEYNSYQDAMDSKIYDEVEKLVYQNFYENSTKEEVIKKIMENRAILADILTCNNEYYY